MDRREWGKRLAAAFVGLGVAASGTEAAVKEFVQVSTAEPPLELGDWVRIVDLPEGMCAVGTLTAIEHRHRGKELQVRGRVTRVRGIHLYVDMDRLRREPRP